MHDFTLLWDLLIIFGLGLTSMVALHRIGLPAVLAFLVAGVLCGPYGLALVADVEVIETLAELGIVLLLFTLGMEFSLPHFMRMWKFLLIGGALQVGLTMAVAFGVAYSLGLSVPVSIFIGMLLSISSTALVLRLLDDRNEMKAAHGRNALTILIFQDLCLVPMLLVVPFLGTAEFSADVFLDIGVKVIGFAVAAVLVVKYLLPLALDLIAQTKNRSAFIIAIIFICLGTAVATAHMGLSMALGAFAAGLVLSESKYNHQALTEVIPFRELFNCLVFVSIGMLFNVRTLLEMPLLIAACVVAVVVGKAVIAGGVTRLFGHSTKVSVLTGLALAQTSEFSFVLGKVGLSSGVISPEMNQLFLSVAILSMMVSPAITALGPKISRSLESIAPNRKAKRLANDMPGEVDSLKDHIIIIGFGHKGKQLAKALEQANIPFFVIHNDPIVVREETIKGRMIVYGTVSEELLSFSSLSTAKLVVINLDDVEATMQAADMAKRLNPSVEILVGTDGLHDTYGLVKAGADDVVSSSAMAAIEIVRRVLDKFHIPGYESEKHVLASLAELAKVNSRLVKMSRTPDPFHPAPFKLVTSEVKVEPNCLVAGKTLEETNLHEETGATIAAFQSSDGEPVVNPTGCSVLSEGDTVMILGKADQVAEAALRFQSRPEEVVDEEESGEENPEAGSCKDEQEK